MRDLAIETTRRLMIQDACLEYWEAWQNAQEERDDARRDLAHAQENWDRIARHLQTCALEKKAARALIAWVLQELPEAGKDNDAVYTVWNMLYKSATWLHPEEA